MEFLISALTFNSQPLMREVNLWTHCSEARKMICILLKQSVNSQIKQLDSSRGKTPAMLSGA